MFKEGMAAPKKRHEDKIKTIIRRAGKNNSLVKIWYKDKKGQETVRLTEPYEIRGDHYFGYCKTRDNIRRFNMSNISKATISKKTYDPKWELKLAFKNQIYDNCFEKLAKDNDTKKRFAAGTAGVGLMGAGAMTIPGQLDKGNITGREKLWHSTDKVNVPSILEKGLLKQKAADPNNITNTFFKMRGISPKKALNKVYLARNKGVADIVGTNLIFGNNPRETLETKVPTWKMKEVANPELSGAKTQKEMLKVIEKDPHLSKNVPVAQRNNIAKLFMDRLGPKGTATLENDIAPKYLLKSKHYQKANLAEVKDFIKAKPLRFLKGIGIPAAGILGGGALLAHSLKSNNQNDTV